MIYNNIRKNIVNRDLLKLVDDYINNDVKEEIIGYYFGTVINNLDPDMTGRCKIKISTLFDNLPDTDIPWAIPDFGFIGSAKGSFVVPPIGALVKVHFDHGDVYCPVYAVKGFDANNLPDAPISTSPEGNHTTNYPNNMIFYYVDNYPNGGKDFLSIDKTKQLTTLHHNTGVEVTIDNMGKVTINANMVEISNTAGAFVETNPFGGPFCALIVDPITGAPHQGKLVTNTNIPPIIP